VNFEDILSIVLFYTSGLTESVSAGFLYISGNAVRSHGSQTRSSPPSSGSAVKERRVDIKEEKSSLIRQQAKHQHTAASQSHRNTVYSEERFTKRTKRTKRPQPALTAWTQLTQLRIKVGDVILIIAVFDCVAFLLCDGVCVCVCVCVRLLRGHLCSLEPPPHRPPCRRPHHLPPLGLQPMTPLHVRPCRRACMNPEP